MKVRNMIAGLFLMAGFLAISDTSVNAQTPPPVDATVAPASYVVQPGDYLAKIASEYETTYVRLFDANPAIADPNIINPGQTIRIPAVDEQLASRAAAVAPQPVARAARPAAQPRQAAPSRPVVANSDVWARLAACESGGRANINTGNGYYGAYQFSASTWRGVGGTGLPSDASLEEQTARAQALQARSGWGQWPECSAKLGLR